MNTLHGIFLIATGRARGIEKFGAGRRDFLISLYMLMSVPVMVGTATIGRYGGSASLGMVLLLACALLTPPVISHFLARLWGREALWLRFATVFNWSRIGIVAVFALLLVAIAMLIQLGFPRDAAGSLLLGTMSLYSLWLEWFIARHALRLGGGRAAVMVVLINGGTFLLLAAPEYLMRLMGGNAGAE